jgi:uncharacterized integral membrane protein
VVLNRTIFVLAAVSLLAGAETPAIPDAALRIAALQAVFPGMRISAMEVEGKR